MALPFAMAAGSQLRAAQPDAIRMAQATDDKKQDPKKQEPKKQEPKKEEPKKQEPKKEEPKKQEPKKEEPRKQEPKKQEPKKDEPKKQEPKKEEPKKQEPRKQEPKKEEPKGPQSKGGTSTTTPSSTTTTPPAKGVDSKQKQPTQGADPKQKQLTPSTTTTTTTPPAGGTTAAPTTQGAPLTPSGTPLPTQKQLVPIAPAAAGRGIAPLSASGAPLVRIEQLRTERRETRDGNRVIIREPDRTIIREGKFAIIRHNELDRFRYGAQDVRVERRGNENVTVVIRPGGDRIVTIVDDDGYLLRRSRILPDGREIIIIDNGPRRSRGSGFGSFIVDLAPPVIRIPRNQYIVDTDAADPRTIYETLIAPPVQLIERAYSLDEIRFNVALRDRMRRIDLNTITFDTGSWEIAPDQLDRLAVIADGINRAIAQNPRELFLIEGYTDAVGSDVDNLSLSDRRAESVALALTQQFNVPPENLSSQGYGEQFLKVETSAAERANRRVAVRRVTPLITGQAQ